MLVTVLGAGVGVLPPEPGGSKHLEAEAGLAWPFAAVSNGGPAVGECCVLGFVSHPVGILCGWKGSASPDGPHPTRVECSRVEELSGWEQR